MISGSDNVDEWRWVDVNATDDGVRWKSECSDDTGEWKWRETNTMLMKVNTCNNEGVLFVVQTSTCTRATRTDWSAQTGSVCTRVMCITATTTVATEVTTYPRTTPTPSRLSELCRSILSWVWRPRTSYKNRSVFNADSLILTFL